MVSPLMRVETLLTGETRHRRTIFGRMVLEVEEQHRHISGCPPPPGRNRNAWAAYLYDTAGATWLTWRDATYEDVNEIARRTLKNAKPVGDT